MFAQGATFLGRPRLEANHIISNKATIITTLFSLSFNNSNVMFYNLYGPTFELHRYWTIIMQDRSTLTPTKYKI